MNVNAKPIEKLLVNAARDSGCTDDAGLEQALLLASQNGGKFIDAILDAAIEGIFEEVPF